METTWLLKCNKCFDEVNSKDISSFIINHVKAIHTIRDMYCCNECLAYFTKEGWREHNEIFHKDKKSFSCSVCNFACLSLEKFQG